MMYRQGVIELPKRVRFKTALPFRHHDMQYAAGQVVELFERDAESLSQRGLGQILPEKRKR